MKKKKKVLCDCKRSDCLECLITEIKSLTKLISPPKRKKKAKKEPPAKCGVCRRRLIPGDGGTFCMTCQYRMDHDSR